VPPLDDGVEPQLVARAQPPMPHAKPMAAAAHNGAAVAEARPPGAPPSPLQTSGDAPQRAAEGRAAEPVTNALSTAPAPKELDTDDPSATPRPAEIRMPAGHAGAVRPPESVARNGGAPLSEPRRPRAMARTERDGATSSATPPRLHQERRPIPHSPDGDENPAERGATGPQLRRFIKSRAYVPMHELRRRFAINGHDDEVTPVDLERCRVFVGLPDREGRLLAELLRAGDIGYELSMDPITPIVVGVYPMRPVTRP
jgi:hypothetical protein